MKIRTGKDRDFEFFVRSLSKLEPIEFQGICRILSVPMIVVTEEAKKQCAELSYDKNAVEESKKQYFDKIREICPPRSMEDILNDLMDKFLGLTKKRRREIVQIFKDLRKGM